MIDTAKIIVRSGNGGDGCISFRREKYVPLGGPDGGDGGRGGDVIIRASEGLHMLTAFRYNRAFSAGPGGIGKGRQKTGKTGNNCVIEVPVGTMVAKIEENGRRTILADLSTMAEDFVVAVGGEGGRGNRKFTSPVNRSPLLAEEGEKPNEIELELELQVLADAGIIGKPSVGKSSLLRACSRARPDVAAYPFTTLEPVLGLVETEAARFVIAEIPGLIEGAHSGSGLGHDFLRHMRRTTGVIHLLDGTSQDLIRDYKQIRYEMGLYDGDLLNKWEVIAVNKVDLPEVKGHQNNLMRELEHLKREVFFISAITGEGVAALMDSVASRVGPERGSKKEDASKIEVIIPKPRREPIKILKEENTFIIRSSRAERIVNRANLDDWQVQAQILAEFKKMGVIRALEKAGIKEGATVRVGGWELEWN